MTTLICDPELEERLLRQRRESGADRFDEVWDGVYVMSPMADDEHQLIALEIAYALRVVLGAGRVRLGINVTDQADDWRQNYRVPDVAVFLADTKAQNLGAAWLGGPDFAVEVRSRGERTLEKLEFYAAVGTREVLVVDRYPWSLSLYRLKEGELRLVGESKPEAPAALGSEVVPLSFGLTAGGERPVLVVEQIGGPGRWTA